MFRNVASKVMRVERAATSTRRRSRLLEGDPVKRIAGLCMGVLLALVAMSGVAYAAIEGTHGHDWGENKKMNPPGCSKDPCGKQIQGTPWDNRIYGYAGWDWIGAKGGNDVVFGGPAMDQIYGDNGRDELHGGRGHDHLFGGFGNDKILTQDGRNEPDHVEQAMGAAGYDRCVMDEDTQEAIVVTACEVLVLKPVEGMRGATRLATGLAAWEKRDFVIKRFYPGTYHL
jgi:tetrahydromethanopterin S-methyltransferase subunit F